MSDNLHLDDEVTAIMSVSFDELADYFNNVGASRSCEACGNDSWSVSMNGDQPVINEISVFNSGDVTLTFLLICKKCGNLRMPLAKFVAKQVIGSRKK